MKRWAVSVILAAVVGGGLLLSTLIRPAVRPATQLQPAKAPRDPDAFASVKAAMKGMGYEGVTFSAVHWHGQSCAWHTYLIQPSRLDSDPFFAVKNLSTGEIRSLKATEFAETLKRYVTYDGTYLGGTRQDENGNVYYSLGSIERDGELVFVFVRFDEHACGLKIVGVWYWAPRVDEKVKLNLQLLP